MKIYRMSQNQMVAYHGTSSKNYERVLNDQGLKNPYLTDAIDRAKYYAEVVSEEDGSSPVVLEVSVPSISSLRYDGNAMDEPVMASEKDRNKAWNNAAKQHPEWMSGEYISIPKEEWKISWDAVGSVWYEGIIPIQYIEELSL